MAGHVAADKDFDLWRRSEAEVREEAGDFVQAMQGLAERLGQFAQAFLRDVATFLLQLAKFLDDHRFALALGLFLVRRSACPPPW